MKMPHTRYHWIAVALVLAALLFTLSEAHGQVVPSIVPGEIDKATDKGIKPKRDQSVAKEERSAVKKSKRAAKRVVKRSRTGVGDIDS